MSPYQFIVLIKKNYPKSKSKIKKIKHKNLNIIANRPKYSYLGISKLIATVNNSPTIKEINKYISDI
jgi:dTDP-4-dehydrorhamnose reductase